jgi:hypothetical protein
MADISTTLILDDKQFQSAITKAEKSTTRFSNNFEKETSKATVAIEGLGQAIAGLGFAKLITDSLNLGKQLTALSNSTGIAIRNIKGLQDSFIAAGGSTDQANDALNDLVKNMGDAREGGGELLKAFTQVGVSLTDLATLSEQDILRKTIQGLAQIPDSSTRSSVGMKLMGEAIKGVDFTNVNKSIDQFTARASGIDSSARAAAAASKNLSAAYGAVQTGVLGGLEPLTASLAKIADYTQEISILVKNLTYLAGALAGLFIISKVGGAFASAANDLSKVGAAGLGIGGIFAGLGQKTQQLKYEFIELVGSFRKTGGGLEATSSVFKKLLSGIGGVVGAFVRFIPIIATVATALIGVNAAVEMITGNSLIDWAEKAAKALGLIDQTTKEAAKAAETKAAADAKATNENTRQVGVLTRLKLELEGITGAYRASIAETSNRINLERQLIGLSENQKELVTQRYEAEAAYLKEINTLLEKYKKADITPEEQQEIAKAIQETTTAYEGQLKTLPELVALKQQEEATDRKRIATANEYKTIQEGIRDVQAETAKLTMTEIEKKEYDIKRAAEARARAYIEAEEARTGIKISSADQQKIIDEYVAGTKDLIAATKESYNQSRTFATGWKQAMNDYIKNATDAAGKARNIFNKAFTGMEDLLVNFAKTGKFEWKNFVAMMLEELLRAQIQVVFAQLLGQMTGSMQSTAGGGGLLGGIGNMLGGGQQGGGLISGGGIGGGQGGSLLGSIFSGIGNFFSPGGQMGGDGMGPPTPAGSGYTWLSDTWSSITDTTKSVWDSVSSVGSTVWDSVSSVGSNIVSGLSSIGSGIWDTVSSIGSAVGSFFGGFFADGGRLGAGKWGIAGEAGPEIISGPANITPMSGMGGGVTNVNYTIHAVDAQSFKQLLAQDPSYLYGLTMMGAKGVPMRR